MSSKSLHDDGVVNEDHGAIGFWLEDFAGGAFFS
jgi:hypothetical protein